MIHAGSLSALKGTRGNAIALLNSHVNDAHETRLGDLAREAGFDHVTLSSEASPLIKLIPRASTAVIDAYLQPVLREYVGRVDRGLSGAPLYFMQSGGGLSHASAFHARNAVLSGPAGGVVGMALTAKKAGYDKAIGFDMGGTSTDVSRYDGANYARTDMASLDGRILRAPMLSVHTVAAGGGSVLAFDGERARVGPKSAGADPGPACYGRGGPPAVTDANVVLGRIQPDWFPKVFGPNHDAPLDADASHAALSSLAKDMGLESAEKAAEGFLAVAVEAMADAIKQISTAQGVDPRAYALNAFGGAGGQHACKVAAALGMTTALIHPQAGLLSAYGIGLAPIRDNRETGLEITLDEDGLARAAAELDTLEAEARASVERQGGTEVKTNREVRLRGVGFVRCTGYDKDDEGRVRAIGVSNHSPEQMDAFREVAPLHACQPPYNLFERAIENDVLPYCRQNGITLLTYGALCRGLLSGQMTATRSFEGDDLRQGDPKFQQPRYEQYLNAVERLNQFTQQHYDRQVIHLAIRWILDQGVDVALWGARTPDQLDPVDDVSGWSLTEDDLAEIDRILDDTIEDPVGPEFMAPPSREDIE